MIVHVADVVHDLPNGESRFPKRVAKIKALSDMRVITFAPAIDLALQNHQINEENDVYYRCKMVRRVIKTS